MIGTDTGGYVFTREFTAKSGCVTVDGKLKVMSRSDLFHHLRIFVKHPGKIHHFAEILYIGFCEEAGDSCGIEGGSRGFELRGRDAAGRSEVEIERNGLSIGNHEFDSGHAAYVCDLMG